MVLKYMNRVTSNVSLSNESASGELTSSESSSIEKSEIKPINSKTINNITNSMDNKNNMDYKWSYNYNENGRIVFPIPETVKTPWFRSRGDLPVTLEYFSGTMYEMIEEVAKKHPLNIALDFMGKHITYKYMVDQINLCARSLRVLGIRENDKVTIAMPNCPQAIYMLYAVNLVGAVGNMVHPLSAEKEMCEFLHPSAPLYFEVSNFTTILLYPLTI
jgi:hypothetical protein